MPLSNSNDFLGTVRKNLRTALERGRPSVDYVAELLHMSARTLQRRLTELNTSFNQVVEEVREQLARMYLDQPALSLAEVAYLLGYSDLTVFVRAFRRWTKMTPGEYRKSRSPQPA